MITDIAITVPELKQKLRVFPPPAVVDVRRAPAFERDPSLIPGAIQRDPAEIATWSLQLESWRPIVVYCVHGHEVSQNAAAALRATGFDARFLELGIEGWREKGGTVTPYVNPTRWVTRERPKIDRIACPWLIRRFLDPAAEFFYVPNAQVRSFAIANEATPYDVPDVAYSHDGTQCSFDAFIRLHQLDDDQALARLATIVRGADTGVPTMAAEAPGLLAVSLGLSAMIADDHAMLHWGMLVYDALYAWCRGATSETHGWNPAALRAVPP